MQLSAFAESQSAEGIPEAVTSGSGQLQEQSGKTEERSAGSGQTQKEQTAENKQTMTEERSASNEQIKNEEQKEKNGQETTEDQSVAEKSAADRSEQQERAASGKIEAKVYLTVMKCLQPSIIHLLWENLVLQEMTSHISQ